MNVSTWEKMYHSRLETEFKEGWREKESTYASYAYDATWVYARALEKYVANHQLEAIHTHANTLKFMNFLREVTFKGVSGNLAFKKNSTSTSSSGSSKSKRSIPDDPKSMSGVQNCPGSDSSDREDTFVYLQQNFLGGRGNKKVAIYKNQQLEVYNDGVEKNLGFSKIQWPNNTPIKDMLVEITCDVAPLDKWLGLDDGEPGCAKTVAILNVFGGIVGFGLIVVIFFTFHKKLRRMKENATRMNGLGILGTGHPCLQLDDWEIPRENIVINRKLGEGAFGKYLSSWVDGQPFCNLFGLKTDFFHVFIGASFRFV